MDLDAFVRDGYVAIRGAVDAGTVAGCQELIWAAMERRGVRRDDPCSWPPLVEDLSGLAGEPFVAAYMAPALTAAHDELIGPIHRVGGERGKTAENTRKRSVATVAHSYD